MYSNIQQNVRNGRDVWNKLDRRELQEKETSIGKLKQRDPENVNVGTQY
jgi:hypothetical protein